MTKVFIDGSAGTTGLRIHERLSERKDIDLIILDIDMPEISGFEMYDAIKKNAKTKNIPIIFLTGVEDEEILEKVKSLNEDYIEKPISTDALLMHVKKLLKK